MSSQQYNLSLKNGKAMIDGKLVTTNIYVKDETINLISEKNFESDETIDCKNLLILPGVIDSQVCLLYTSPSPRDKTVSRMPSSA